MEITKVSVGDLQVNCYILSVGSDAVVIDAGDEYEKIIKAANGKNIKAVLLTHGHFDHTGAVNELQKNGAKVYISKNEEYMLSDSYSCLSAPFGFPFNEIKADFTFNDGDILDLCGMNFKVILTPGHTTGSACFLVDDVLFSGDTLFYRSIGRTDFPGGDFEVISKNIREKLYTLPENTVVYAGHGEETTIGEEKRSNPFVR